MATEAPAKPRKATWRDWLPKGSPEPDRLYTRDEIIAMIARRHVAGTQPVTVGDLRYWESIGVLPHGVRQWRDGAARALFPDWYANLARRVRLLQRTGYSLDEIRPRIRAHFRLMFAHAGDDDGADDEFRNAAGRVRTAEEISLWPALVEELERLSRWRAQLTGSPTERVEVRVIGSDGTGTIYPLPIAPHDGETETPS